MKIAPRPIVLPEPKWYGIPLIVSFVAIEGIAIGGAVYAGFIDVDAEVPVWFWAVFALLFPFVASGVLYARHSRTAPPQETTDGDDVHWIPFSRAGVILGSHASRDLGGAETLYFHRGWLRVTTSELQLFTSVDSKPAIRVPIGEIAGATTIPYMRKWGFVPLLRITRANGWLVDAAVTSGEWYDFLGIRDSEVERAADLILRARGSERKGPS